MEVCLSERVGPRVGRKTIYKDNCKVFVAWKNRLRLGPCQGERPFPKGWANPSRWIRVEERRVDSSEEYVVMLNSEAGLDGAR